jgi:prepilin-type N-terminal cleavage/methylation domain-containing protein
MDNSRINQTGFTLLEVTIVVLIISILLGFTVAIIPKQQELRRYKAADREMDKIIDTLIGFAQVNGRLPCPASIVSAGVEEFTVIFPTHCNNFGGFVPVNTLGIQGRLNAATLLLDPWGNPYRYYVSSSNVNSGAPDLNADFTVAGQMQEIGLVDEYDAVSDPDDPVFGTADGYIDLDGQFVICDAASTTVDICAGGANEVFGNAPTTKGPYAGAIVVLLSTGKNGNQTPIGDELENRGSIVVGQYFLKKEGDVGVRETTFVKRTTGFDDDFDDIVKWISPSVLFSKMIEADQLP